jgi:hypothetical protein
MRVLSPPPAGSPCLQGEPIGDVAHHTQGEPRGGVAWFLSLREADPKQGRDETGQT